MTWWQITLIALAIPVVYFVYRDLTGKRRREKILKQIIKDTYFTYRNKTKIYRGVLYFEAVQQFAEENNGYTSQNYASVDTIIDNEEIYTSFFYDTFNDSIEVKSMSKEENEEAGEILLRKKGVIK